MSPQFLTLLPRVEEMTTLYSWPNAWEVGKCYLEVLGKATHVSLLYCGRATEIRK